VALDEGLRPAACGVAQRLRAGGRSVELVLEPKKMKWAFKVRCECICSDGCSQSADCWLATTSEKGLEARLSISVTACFGSG
jgi:hypothetical protein